MNENLTMTKLGRKTTFQSLETENLLLNGFSAHNPLLAAAFPLVQLFMYLRTPQKEMNPAELQSAIIAEINLFANQAKASHCLPQLILAAQYCLCTALDEAILLTPWGAQSGWAQQSLLSIIHHETWGGERFFIILEKMALDPKKNLPLLELLYLLLTLGFEGKYYNEDRMLREELQHRLYQLIVVYHPEISLRLSPSIPLDEWPQPIKSKSIPHQKFFAAILAAVLGVGVLLNITLYFKAKPFLQSLNDIGTGRPTFLLDAAEKIPQKHLHRHRSYQ